MLRVIGAAAEDVRVVRRPLNCGRLPGKHLLRREHVRPGDVDQRRIGWIFRSAHRVGDGVGRQDRMVEVLDDLPVLQV